GRKRCAADSFKHVEEIAVGPKLDYHPAFDGFFDHLAAKAAIELDLAAGLKALSGPCQCRPPVIAEFLDQKYLNAGTRVEHPDDPRRENTRVVDDQYVACS